MSTVLRRTILRSLLMLLFVSLVLPASPAWAAAPTIAAAGQQVVPPDIIDCQPSATLVTGEPNTYSTSAPGSTNAVAHYMGVGTAMLGREYIYKFVPTTDGPASVRFIGSTVRPMYLVVLSGESGSCNTANRIASGSRSATFEAQQGVEYYVVVDSPGVGGARFTVVASDQSRLPAYGAEMRSQKPWLEWPDTPRATSYLLVVSSHPDLSLPMYKVRVLTSRFDFPASLPRAVQLFWRYTPRVDGINAPPSEISTFMTADPPGRPVAISPINNVLIRTLQPTLKWSVVAPSATRGFSTYRLQIATDAAFYTVVVDTSIDNREQASISLPYMLLYNTKYFWRVRSVNLGGSYSSWSPVQSFHTGLSAPVLQSPWDGEPLDTLRPFFLWSVVEKANRYRLAISTDPNFVTGVWTAGTTKHTFSLAMDLLPGTTYYYKVRAYGTDAPSDWSTVWHFTTP